MNIINEIFSEFNKNRSNIEMSVDQMSSELLRFGKNILLYGAGSSGIAFLYDLKKIGITPIYFVDSNEKKIGRICEGIEIISPKEITHRVSGEFIVIVCINTDGKRYCKSFDEALRIGGHHGVYEKLHSMGCKNVIDYTYFRRCFSIFRDEKYNAPSCSDIDLMIENEEKIFEVFGFLSDDMSRDIFLKILRFRLLDDSLTIPTLPQDTQYFENGLYQVEKDAVFVDCGAYNGISAKTFLSLHQNIFEKYYGVEPDPRNYKRLAEFIMRLDIDIRKRINILEKAVWDRICKLKLYSLEGPGSFVAEDIGTTIISATTIDEVLNGGKATFIKMNIEGSEKQALHGGRMTIRIFKPRLAIAGYHRTDDLWMIPLIMKNYREDYTIYLRSYMNHMSFVYYAM